MIRKQKNNNCYKPAPLLHLLKFVQLLHRAVNYVCTGTISKRSIHLFLAQDELSDIGSLYKVQVTGPHSELKQPWHLDLLHMKHTGTKEEMYLAFDCLFNPNEDKCVELPALYADQEPLPGKLSLFFVTGVRIGVTGIPVSLLG